MDSLGGRRWYVGCLARPDPHPEAPMLKRMLRPISAASIVAGSLFASSAFAAPYVTLKDPAEIETPDDSPNLSSWRKKLLEQYELLGLELPEVFSIWTAFPMAGGNYGTFIDPRENDVSG